MDYLWAGGAVAAGALLRELPRFVLNRLGRSNGSHSNGNGNGNGGRVGDQYTLVFRSLLKDDVKSTINASIDEKLTPLLKELIEVNRGIEKSNIRIATILEIKEGL